MAWLSRGANNSELCEELVNNGVLSEPQIIQAFMFTDRGDFVPSDLRLGYLKSILIMYSQHIKLI